MTKQLTLLVNSQDEIERSWEHDVEDVGPFKFPNIPESYRYVVVTELFNIHNPPTTSSVAKLGEGNVPCWIETATVEDLKLHKNAEINSCRLTANRSFFMFQGKKIACDELSRSDIDAVSGVVSLLNMVPISQWKTVDNTYVPIPDKDTWIQFYMAMVQQGQANFDKAQNLKTTLASAVTPEEIAAIKWS